MISDIARCCIIFIVCFLWIGSIFLFGKWLLIGIFPFIIFILYFAPRSGYDEDGSWLGPTPEDKVFSYIMNFFGRE